MSILRKKGTLLWLLFDWNCNCGHWYCDKYHVCYLSRTYLDVCYWIYLWFIYSSSRIVYDVNRSNKRVWFNWKVFYKLQFPLTWSVPFDNIYYSLGYFKWKVHEKRDLLQLSPFCSSLNSNFRLFVYQEDIILPALSTYVALLLLLGLAWKRYPWTWYVLPEKVCRCSYNSRSIFPYPPFDVPANFQISE